MKKKIATVLGIIGSFAVLGFGAMSIACEKHGAGAHDDGHHEHSEATHNHDEGTAAAADVAKEAGGRRIAIEVADSGYKPGKVEVKAGEPVTLVFTRTSEYECGSKVTIPDHKIERELPLNKSVEIPFTPSKTGPVAFMCGMKMMRGSIVVVQ